MFYLRKGHVTHIWGWRL